MHFRSSAIAFLFLKFILIGKNVARQGILMLIELKNYFFTHIYNRYMGGPVVVGFKL